MADRERGMSLREFAAYMKKLDKASPGVLLNEVLADPEIRDTLRRRGVSVNGLAPIEHDPSDGKKMAPK